MKKPVVLIVMDGLGISDPASDNAVSLANTPSLDLLQNEYPSGHLNASGEAVGLPDGQMGNSEVGHLNLGAGRVVYQSLSKLNKAIKERTFFDNSSYIKACTKVKEQGSKLHVFGLLSDGGVHSHIDHMKAFVDLAKEQGLEEVYVHAFLDGRDTPPASGVDYIKELEDHMNKVEFGCIASVHGRYYAMDRDKNYDRIQIAYDVMISGKGKTAISALEGVKASYAEGKEDEFVVPFLVNEKGLISDNDSVIFANFRPDRAIQIATAVSNPEGIVYTEGKAKLDISAAPNNIFFVSTMFYNDSVNGEVAYPLETIENMYGDIISAAGMKQLRIAETEKYAHVTFFFDGGVDREIKGSDRVLVASPAVATYDLKPEMSAYEVTDKLMEEIEAEKHDCIFVNYANADLV